MVERESMPVCLVTGATGFLGRPLLDVLAKSTGWQVIGVGRQRPVSWQWTAASFIVADLTSPSSVRAAVDEADPSIVFHLAGKTPPAPSEVLYTANTIATAHLLDALRVRQRPTRVVLAGSAAELGPVAVEDLPVAEGHPCRPETPYGLSKWLATCAGLAALPPLEVLIARIFNPIGPGTPDTQALGRFATWLSDPRLGDLSVGRLDTRRDFVDVRDVARALLALAEYGQNGQVYHVGTGRSHLMSEGLDRLHELSGQRVRVTTDSQRAGNGGPNDSRADIRRIVEDTGWKPEISWEQSLDDLWREVCARPRLPLTV